MDWETVIYALVAGMAASPLFSLVKDKAGLGTILRLLPWSWGPRVAAALLSAGAAGAAVQVPTGGDAAIGFLAGMLGGQVAWLVLDKLGWEAKLR